MTILVTGATGGIGRTLVPLLASSRAEVIATGRDAAIGRTLTGGVVRFAPANLVHDDLAPLVRGVGVVVHLAARSSPWGPSAAFEMDNVVATARLLDAAATAGVHRFIFASTPSIFAGRQHRLDLRADSPPTSRQLSHYARTKLLAERLVLRDRRFSTLVLRPSAVIGPHDRAILPRLLRVLDHGIFPVGNAGTALLHPTDVRDAASAFAAAAHSAATGVANIAGREPVGIVAMARALAARLNVAIRVRCLPEPALHALAQAAEWWGVTTGREPPLTRFSVSTLSWSRTFNLGEAESLFGWQPAYAPAQALAHAVQR